MYSLQDRINYVKNNPEIFATNGTSAGLIIERMAGGTNFVDEEGYDYFDLVLGRVEVKSTCIPQGKNMRVQKYVGKRGKFDHIHIIDGYNNREFIIPHDDWFEYVDEADMFWWSVSYNATDRARRGETEFLLQYEVTNAKG